MSRSKSKRQKGNGQPVKQTQSPPTSSSPSSRVTKPDWCKNKKKNKKRPPRHYNVPNNGGLQSNLPQAGSPNHSITKDERSKPCVNSSRIKIQEPGESKPTQLQCVRAPKVKVIYESESEFEFEFEFAYKDPAHAQAPLQSQLQSQSTSLERVVGREEATPASCPGHRQQSRGTSESESTSESQSVFSSESRREISLPSPPSPERIVDHEEVTPASLTDYEQQTHESILWDIDNEYELSSEVGSGLAREPFLSSPSPYTSALPKRSRPSAHDSRRKAVQAPVPSTPESLHEFEPGPSTSLEFVQDMCALFVRYAESGLFTQGNRIQPFRKVRGARPAAWPRGLSAEIGLETPSKAGSEIELFEPSQADVESESESQSEAEDDSDDELPTAKRPRYGLSVDSPEPNESTEPGSSNPGHLSNSEQTPDLHESAEREQSSGDELGLDLEPDLDLIASSELELVPELESPSAVASSDPEGKQLRTPTSIRDELPTRLVRQLNKKIEEAVSRDKEENPSHWGGLWMKEYARGGEIKERVEAEYRQDMIRKKEEEAKRKRIEKVDRDKKKKERERKRMEEQKMQEREARKKAEEQKKKKSQKRGRASQKTRYGGCRSCRSCWTGKGRSFRVVALGLISKEIRVMHNWRGLGKISYP
ncbi:hypothetical protein N7491_006358 [Penicillium cf. griseofulvum]|nr:hypothetical protein N7491_006358 [Penicillium cf. griseofulvum]